jgi:hypothetical protein
MTNITEKPETPKEGTKICHAWLSRYTPDSDEGDPDETMDFSPMLKSRIQLDVPMDIFYVANGFARAFYTTNEAIEAFRDMALLHAELASKDLKMLGKYAYSLQKILQFLDNCNHTTEHDPSIKIIGSYSVKDETL